MALPNLLNQTVSVYPRASYDSYGREVLGSAVSYKARVQEVTKTIQQPNGQIIAVDAIAYLNANPTISINDKVSFNSTTYKVVGKSTAIDGQGNTNHVKLMLAKSSI